MKKPVEYVDSKEDPLKQTVKTHQLNNVTDRRLKRELQRGTRQIKESVA
jgi:hypothetical protein